MTAFAIVALKPGFDRVAFRSGIDALDRYFRELAPQDVKRRISGCFVALDDDDDSVAGFYTLAATIVPFDSLPAELTKRLARYPLLPAMLLGRLAIASSHQGKGLGRAVIADALLRTDGFGIAAYALIVDAKDERAVAFYERTGFARIPGEQRRMFLPMATALKALAPPRGV